MNRRTFLRQTGLAAGAAAVHNLPGAAQKVSLIADPNDAIASSEPSSWAIRADSSTPFWSWPTE